MPQLSKFLLLSRQGLPEFLLTLHRHKPVSDIDVCLELVVWWENSFDVDTYETLPAFRGVLSNYCGWLRQSWSQDVPSGSWEWGWGLLTRVYEVILVAFPK